MENYLRNINKELFFELKTLEKKIKFLLRYAILAPSTHNSQPWLFKITSNSCKIYSNSKISIKEADPLGRDLYISLGCLIENLTIAAKYFGVYENIIYRLNEEKNLVAEVFFKDNQKKENIDRNFEKLLEVIPKRFNARGLFENKKIEEEVLKNIVLVNSDKDLRIDFITEKEKIEKLSGLTAEGLKIAYLNSAFRKEMSGWINNNFSSKKRGIPGYALRMPAILSFIIPTLIKFFNLGKMLAKLNYQSMVSAPLVCVISARNNSPLTWLKIGRLSERLMLEFNLTGVKTSIFVAAVEMDDLYKKIQTIINSEYIPQFLFVAGYMDFQPKFTPREPLENKIIK
ncbi:MAG: hypothetical protein HYV52_00200 [Parcubacteria group bacterium]|nr:hypothetical protein [Parcubacteria group bacterium]